MDSLEYIKKKKKNSGKDKLINERCKKSSLQDALIEKWSPQQLGPNSTKESYKHILHAHRCWQTCNKKHYIVTYMPYSGVVWVTLPVTCKRKEIGSDAVDVVTSFVSPLSIQKAHTHAHVHTHIQRKLCTQNIPAWVLLYTARPNLGALEKVFVYSGEG